LPEETLLRLGAKGGSQVAKTQAKTKKNPPQLGLVR
jgi:hypothetical protein